MFSSDTHPALVLNEDFSTKRHTQQTIKLQGAMETVQRGGNS